MSDDVTELSESDEPLVFLLACVVAAGFAFLFQELPYWGTTAVAALFVSIAIICWLGWMGAACSAYFYTFGPYE